MTFHIERLVAEAEASNLDICQTLLKITIPDLFGPKFLNAPEIWLAGYDWTLRYPRAESPRQMNSSSNTPSENGSPKLESVATASVSSGTGGSGSDRSDERPSPATTMRTTPSPSPESKSRFLDNIESPDLETMLSDDTVDLASTIVPSQALSSASSPIFVGPRTPPRPLEVVPRIPPSLDHIGRSVLQRIVDMWRETISPVFECTCAICRRATEESTPDVDFDLSNVDMVGQALELAQFERNMRNREVVGVLSDDEYEDEEDYEDDYEEDEEEEDWPNNAEWVNTIENTVADLSDIQADQDMEIPVEAGTFDTIAIPEAPVDKHQIELVVGGRRSRDPEDVGGPGSEIVTSEGDLGHGRKRLKSQ